MKRSALLLFLLAGCQGPEAPLQSLPDLARALPAPDLAALQASDLAVAPASDLAVAPAPDLAERSYPPGPYGSNVGNVFPNFTFQGYWAPKQTMGLASDGKNGLAPITMEMLHKSGAKLAFIEFAGFT